MGAAFAVGLPLPPRPRPRLIRGAIPRRADGLSCNGMSQNGYGQGLCVMCVRDPEIANDMGPTSSGLAQNLRPPYFSPGFRRACVARAREPDGNQAHANRDQAHANRFPLLPIDQAHANRTGVRCARIRAEAGRKLSWTDLLGQSFPWTDAGHETGPESSDFDWFGARLRRTTRGVRIRPQNVQKRPKKEPHWPKWVHLGSI